MLTFGNIKKLGCGLVVGDDFRVFLLRAEAIAYASHVIIKSIIISCLINHPISSFTVSLVSYCKYFEVSVTIKYHS